MPTNPFFRVELIRAFFAKEILFYLLKIKIAYENMGRGNSRKSRACNLSAARYPEIFRMVIPEVSMGREAIVSLKIKGF